jgi:hypothetical protein
MDKLEYALRTIANCDLCNGLGYQGWANGEDYDMEDCICNPYGLILEGGEVIFDNGLLSEPELFTTQEAY